MSALTSERTIKLPIVGKWSQKTVYRLAFILGSLGAFLLFWVNGAVGIIGNEGHPANLMYFGLIGFGIIGSIISKFKAKGMAITLAITTVLQFLVPIVALLVWASSDISWSPGMLGVFLLNGFFVLVFAIAAYLFHKAS